MLVEFNKHDAILNWHELPEPISLDLILRDEIFEELQQKFKTIDQKTLLDMNKFVINKIKLKYSQFCKTNTKSI